jgi:hypothetical protein
MQDKIYWEQQGVDRLCGVHSVNSLLQGTHLLIKDHFSVRLR